MHRLGLWVRAHATSFVGLGNTLIASFLTLAAAALLLPEFDALRVDAGMHRPFVAVLFATAVLAAYVAWKRVVEDATSESVFVFLAFAALAGIYSPHALLEASGPDPAHLIFGPVSRAAFGALLFAAMVGLPLPGVARSRRGALVIAASLIVAADLLLHTGAFQRALLDDPLGIIRPIEWVAVGFLALALGALVRRRRQAHSRFLGAVSRAIVAMATSSLLFLESAPWMLRWWVAHLGLVAASAVIISAVLIEHARGGSLASVVDIDEASSVADLLLDELDAGLVLVNWRGEVVGWNGRAAELTGWSRDDAEHDFPRAALHGLVHLGGTPVRARHVTINRVGRPLEATFFEDARGEVELREENRRLDEMAAALERANAAKSELLGMVAHDLRNPLGAVRGFSQLLHERLGPNIEEVDRLVLNRIEAASDRMLGMVDELLEFAEFDDGSLTPMLDKQDADLLHLVEEIVDLLRPEADRKAITLRVYAGEADAAGEFDPAKMEQVVTNLVTNAIKFSEHGTTVTLAVNRAADAIRVAVSDEGPGIPSDELPKLFQPYARISVKPTAGESSTGLGLSIVRRIVDAHGGSIDVDSVAGQGTTFTVTLPRSSDRMRAPETAAV